MTEGKEKERKGEKCTITTISVACLLHIPVVDMSLGGRIQEVDEWSIYYEQSNLFPLKCLSTLELRTLLTSYSISPLISTGGGRGWMCCGNGSGSTGSNWDMWKTGWMEQKCWGR